MLKLGFIGCGGICRHHANVIRQNVKGIRVAAGADISPEALKAFGAENEGAALYDDYRGMLREAPIDAVCVGLPTGLHKEATTAAAKAGKHVFCEKPMAMALADADAMIEACRAAGVKLMIGQVRRYDPDWGTWRRLVLSGAVGRPVLWRQMSGGAGPGRWYMDAKMGGGPFMDGCVHNWDFANHVFGEPLEALGSLVRFQETTALDSGSAIVRYRGGDEVMLSWSWGLPKGCRAGGGTDILGPRGVIKFPGSFPDSELPEGFDKQKHGAYLVDTGDKKRVVRFVKKNMFAEEWKDFLRCVRRGGQPRATGEAARKAVAVALAVLKAGATRRPVAVRAC